MITGNSFGNQAAMLSFRWAFPRKAIIGVILVVALVAFEVFNFDTTRYALESLLGDVRFLGLGWAVILAIAFCAIDSAGLSSLFAPESGNTERSTWYLMGAWLLGATMNAIMTWWAAHARVFRPGSRATLDDHLPPEAIAWKMREVALEIAGPETARDSLAPVIDDILRAGNAADGGQAGGRGDGAVGAAGRLRQAELRLAREPIRLHPHHQRADGRAFSGGCDQDRPGSGA